MIGSPASVSVAELGLRQTLQHGLLLAGRGGVDAGIERLAQDPRDRGIAFAGVGTRLAVISAAMQAQDQPVLVRAPARAVEAQEGGAGALLAAEAEAAVREALDEPFEADGHLDQPAPEPRRDAVDDGAADDGFADGGIGPPAERLRKR